MAKGVGKMLLYSKLTNEQYKLLCGMFDMIEFCVRRGISENEIRVFAVRVVEGLSQIEKELPATELGIILHLFLHYCDSLSRFGPSYCYWMYIFERMMSYLSRICHDRASPEENICNNYAEHVSMRNIGALFATAIGEAMASVEGQYVRRSLHDDHKKVLNGFPKCKSDRHVSMFMLPNASIQQIFESVNRECDIHNQSDISMKAWKITGGVTIGGLKRGCRDRKTDGNAKPRNSFQKSAFELPAGRVRNLLSRARVFGVIDHFLSIYVGERRVNLVKVSLFRPYEQQDRVITLPVVKFENTFSLKYLVANSSNIGPMKVLLTSPEASSFHLVLDV